MFNGEFSGLFESTKRVNEEFGESSAKIWRTDPEFVIDEDDAIEISQEELSPNSDIWVLQVGDEVTYHDVNTDKDFTGSVIGFGLEGQPGRTMYVETQPENMIYIDGIIYGKGVISASRNGVPIKI